MKLKRSPILTIETSIQKEFEEECERLFKVDYKLIASSCGFINSNQYDFCSIYQAIFQDKYLDIP